MAAPHSTSINSIAIDPDMRYWMMGGSDNAVVLLRLLTYSWQFNFKFSPEEDMHSQTCISSQL